jgi:hypothetical protein
MTLKSKINKVTRELGREMEKAMLKSVIKVHGELSHILSGQRSGFLYPVAGTGRVVNKEKTLPNGRKFYYRKLVGAKMYRASAPYEAPASRLGHLRASFAI